MRGITEKTSNLIEKISSLDCLKEYVLVGGTALSIQLGTRESEDLDFMSWRKSRTDRREVNWPEIKREFEQVATVENMEIYDLTHVEFVIEGVKVSFYASPNHSPLLEEIPFLNNIRLADKKSIGAMKMEVMLRRSKFRDYYDIYSLVRDGQELMTMIELALSYSGHKLKSKNLLSMLTRSERFDKDAAFEALNPLYQVNPEDIEIYFRKILEDNS